MPPDKKKIERILKYLLVELDTAFSKFNQFNTTHEGYAVILEEVDELWKGIKQNQPPNVLREEAFHIAAMAVRFIHDLCLLEREP